MKKPLKLFIFFLVYCILVTTTLTACAFSADHRGEVTIEKLAGVTDESASEIQQAADATRRLFANNTDTLLEKPVNIVLTPDRKSYITETITRFQISELEAGRLAKGTDALSSRNSIIVNMSGLTTPRQKTFLIAHELAHHYQHQLAGNQADQVIWLLEGMADTVGAQVVAEQGYFRLDQYQNNWQSGLRLTASKPDLRQLETRTSWSQSISQYGFQITYKTAGLAVLTLTEDFGQRKVLDYFRGLGRGETPDTAFQKAFGMSITDYESQFTNTLRIAS